SLIDFEHAGHLAGRVLDRKRLAAAVGGARHPGGGGSPPGKRGGLPTPQAGDPSTRQAVATLTAPSTPIVACARCGMKLRTVTAPPCAGGATSIILGTDLSLTSPRFIIGPAARRIFSIFARRGARASPSSSSRVS